jgi:hypothetical protein
VGKIRNYLTLAHVNGLIVLKISKRAPKEREKSSEDAKMAAADGLRWSGDAGIILF